ncbi:SubName: Full=Related to nucleoporin {ECO:0000313/EMBL:CCA72167.1} [Serendipita indica DSM 11827]|nr:SubName: Full=Related to nucleoporin {ECO:0000313/EMBL:CCA72167.1} [Serendipita indica DSM 11827]
MDKAVVTTNIYRDFAQSVEKFQKHRGNPETLVSAHGLAATFKEICTRRATRQLADQRLTDEDRKMLRLEANTWDLLQRVYEHRRKPQSEGRTAQELLKANPYVPIDALYRAWLSYSPRLAELCEVRKWLEATYRLKEPPPLSSEYWKFTRMDLKQKKRQGQTERTGYVRTLDPDAVNRIGDSGVLNADDALEEKQFIVSLFQYIRAGKIEDAAALSQRTARPWRAAVIRGSHHLRWEALNDPHTDSGLNSQEDVWSGNRRWLLWRQTCARAAMSTALSTVDKALHAAISPSVQTLPAVLPLCNSWEDRLWARLSALIGDRIEARLQETAGAFWNRGTLLDRLVLLDQLEGDTKPVAGHDSDWEAVIAHQLEELTEEAVDTNLPMEDFLRRSQLSIIRRQMQPLLAEVEDTFKHPDEPLPASSIRFFAHVWLFLNMINVSNELTQSTTIIEKYIEILQKSGERDIVALYTSFLGHAAIKKYADFLAALPLKTPRAELERGLRSAASYHLNVRLVAQEAAKLSRDRAAKLFPAEPVTLPTLPEFGGDEPLTEGEQHIIRSLGWLRFHPVTKDLILKQSNEDTRWLLCRGRVKAAIQLSVDLPETIISVSGDPSQETEYMLYRKLFSLWDQFIIVQKLISSEPRGMLDGDGWGHWKRRVKEGFEQLFETATSVMTANWGIDSMDDVDQHGLTEDADVVRLKELQRIRKTFIPELAMRLTRQLIDARIYVPNAITMVTQLANLVADGKDKLHLDFVYGGNNRIAEYLLLVPL